MNLIDKWIAMQAVQGIDSVATLRDGDPVIRMSVVEHVLENLPEAPDINVGNMDTTTHDSIPAETGKNDGDGTSGDCISRQQAIDALRAMQTYKMFAGDDLILIDKAEVQTELMMLPPTESEPSQVARDIATILGNEKDMRVIATQPEIIRCKDCKYYKYGICMKIGANKSFYGFCDWAERGE